AATDRLLDLHRLAEENDPYVSEFLLTQPDNPYLDPAEKAAAASGLSEEEYRVRIMGEYAATGYRVYPDFTLSTYGCDSFEIPHDWTRYMVVDPGIQVCAALFAAVPPDEHHIYIYDELYIRRCNADIFGDKVAEKVRDHNFQAFIIDRHGGAHPD